MQCVQPLIHLRPSALEPRVGVTVPWEPMFIKVIIRPNNVPSTFLGAAELGLKYFSYVPAFEPVPTEMVMELQRVRQQLLQQLALQMASEQAHQALSLIHI